MPHVRILSTQRACSMGYASDKRKRRRQHRLAARELMAAGTLLHARSPRGSIPQGVAAWHLLQARFL